VESSSTSDPRLRGALPFADFRENRAVLAGRQALEVTRLRRLQMRVGTCWRTTTLRARRPPLGATVKAQAVTANCFACCYLLVPVVIPVFDPAIVAPGGPIGIMACSYGVFAHIMYGLVGSGSAASGYPNSLLGGPKTMM
jgi:hypothetical protein